MDDHKQGGLLVAIGLGGGTRFDRSSDRGDPAAAEVLGGVAAQDGGPDRDENSERDHRRLRRHRSPTGREGHPRGGREAVHRGAGRPPESRFAVRAESRLRGATGRDPAPGEVHRRRTRRQHHGDLAGRIRGGIPRLWRQDGQRQGGRQDSGDLGDGHRGADEARRGAGSSQRRQERGRRGPGRPRFADDPRPGLLLPEAVPLDRRPKGILDLALAARHGRPRRKRAAAGFARFPPQATDRARPTSRSCWARRSASPAG